MTLDKVQIDQKVLITEVGGEGALRQHLLDMGLIPGVVATVIKYAPMGDPIEVSIHGYELTLRLDDASHIGVKVLEEEAKQSFEEKHITPVVPCRSKSVHPSIGEPGMAHAKGDGDPLPSDTVLRFALIGNQNCGKTTLFNRLTGANQHVGNFPGVTVDRKDGAILGKPNTKITDLPGIYSLSPYSQEELVSRDFILRERPHGIINIIDATNIERNLYLTMQLLELGRPMVIAINMMDELTGNGGSIDINRMEEMLGVPVVPISAMKNQGIEELIDHALHIAKYQEKPLRRDFCGEDDNGGAVHRCLHAVRHLIEDHARAASIPVHFAAGKAVEGDHYILEQLKLETNELEMLEHISLQMEAERGMDRNAAIADMKFSFINNVCQATVKKPSESKEHIRSQRIDSILTGRFTAIPVFILIMASIFFLTFNVIGAWLQDLMDQGITFLSEVVQNLLINSHVNRTVTNLVIDGIFSGVGSVLSFMPIVVVMFFFLSLLEDSGYIARVAFIMDKLLRRIGLSGRSIVPLLIGFGCTVPAVMSTRTLPSERDRKMTILLTPFMSCTAKLPIYAFFANAFFPKKAGLVITLIYLLGIAMGILVAFIYKLFVFKGEAVPFVMELPNYRLPSLRSTMQLMWEKAKDFLQKAFSVILIATIVVWTLQSFSPYLNLVDDSSESIMAAIAGALVPIFKPIGLGDWRIITSLISGFMAKESVVSTLEVLFTGAGGIAAVLNTKSAISLLVFSLLYTPCVAAIASVKRELGKGWAVFLVTWQCVFAWIIAFIVTLIL